MITDLVIVQIKVPEVVALARPDPAKKKEEGYFYVVQYAKIAMKQKVSFFARWCIVNKTRQDDVSQFNFKELQSDVLNSFLLTMGAIIGVWFILWALTQYFYKPPIAFWGSFLVLLLTVTSSYFLKARNIVLASHILVWGMIVSITFILIEYPSPFIASLYIIPVIAASSLLESTIFLGVVILAAGLIVFINFEFNTSPIFQGMNGNENTIVVFSTKLFSTDILLPLGILVLVTFFLQIVLKSLHTSLAWTWYAYQSAFTNEQVAQENQAELKRVMKSLDNAHYGLKRMNYKLAFARAQAEEALRLKQQFAQTISHELRTPLNLIVSFTELMAQSPEYYGGSPPFPYMRDIAIVYRNARHLQSLVNDVLDLARIEAAELIVIPEEVNLTTMTNEVLEITRPLVEASGLVLEANMEANLPKLWVDPIRIRQVIINLINNAVRFTDEGCISVNMNRQKDQIVFSVKDTGIGISKEDIDKIFEEYHQVDGSSHRRYQGAGLGLAICKRFVKLHHGRIWVKSQKGQGSTFYFSLPLDSSADSASVNGVLSVNAPNTVEHFNSKPVLLTVTQNVAAIALLTRHISDFHTIVVQNLEQAYSAVQQSMPQAIVIDSASDGLMPLQVEKLAKEWSLQNTPIIISPFPKQHLHAKELEIDGYLLAPISNQSLGDVFRQLKGYIEKILIISDKRDFVLLTSRLLEDNPIRRYHVRSADSGTDGLMQIRQQSPDLVLMDMQLPDMPGQELIKRIRENDAWQDIQIVVISEGEALDNQEMAEGPLIVAKAIGLKSGEIVRWVQDILSPVISNQRIIDG